MKRFSIVLVAALLVGCHQDNSAPPQSTPDAVATPAPATPATPAPAVASATPAAPATPAPVTPPPAPATPAPATPANPATPARATAETPATPAAVEKPVPAKVIPVYELAQDDKVYVFASVADMLAFQGGKNQTLVLEKPELNPGHRVVVIEAADQAQADAIIAGYAKLHPVSK